MQNKKIILIACSVVLGLVVGVVAIGLSRPKSEIDVIPEAKAIIAEYDKAQAELKEMVKECDAGRSPYADAREFQLRVTQLVEPLEARTEALWEAAEGSVAESEAVFKVQDRQAELDEWSERNLVDIDCDEGDTKDPEQIRAEDRRLIRDELARYYLQNNKWPDPGTFDRVLQEIQDELHLVGFDSERGTWVGVVDVNDHATDGRIHIQSGVKDETTQGDVGQNLHVGRNALKANDLIIITRVACPVGDTIKPDEWDNPELQAGQDGAQYNTLAMYYLKGGQLVCNDYKA